jgi:L-ascorbate metabolism protein UlaG (beta-lactamase superfamily)
VRDRGRDDVGRDHARFGAFLRWQLTRRRGRWAWTDAEPGPPPPERVGRGELRVTFVNHATCLVQADGLNVLTDPIWSLRASPVGWAGPRRVRPPGIRFEDLPPIDAVLVSHDHYDHMDLPTLRRLAAAHRPRLVAATGNRDALGEGALELAWWKGAELAEGVRVTAVPARHWSGRTLLDRNRRLWAGFVVQGPAGAWYFAGDTAWGDHFAAIRERFGPVRLALLPIGSYEPRWFMKAAHVNPEEAVEAHRVLGSGTSVGIHFGTFELSDEDQDEPPRRLRQLLRPAERFWALEFGEGRALD